MNSPSVSIVITAYNAERFIGPALTAALSQDYPRFEVIVVDDGSTDGTGTICRGIADNRFRYVRRDRIGRSRALNEAISLAEGEYIAINDADDISSPDRLRYVMAFLREQPNVVLIGTDYQATEEFRDERFCEDNRSSSLVDDDVRWITRSRMYRSNPFVHSTVVYPKSAWKEAGGYDEALSMCVDYDFFFRIAACGAVAWLPKKTIRYFTHPASYFKNKNPKEYLDTLSRIKRRARDFAPLSLGVRCYDAIPYYVALRSLIFGRR